ncbi:hypothetical protein E2C01_080350 [Portunus trituberculatus]|uniref:Uncharacterized protein n=1 Tax=Portunus trituberculatus TaxID=210409 RepID=A0A5B7ITV5_PORTR|nr:hypothetical protein [Portunus trituberculatus]
MPHNTQTWSRHLRPQEPTVTITAIPSMVRAINS